MRPVGLTVWTVAAVAMSALLGARSQADYEIGHRTLSMMDPARSNRSIPTEVYYPAVTGGEAVPVADPGGAGFPVVSFGHGRRMAWDAYEHFWTALVPAGYICAFPTTEMGLSPDLVNFALDLTFAAGKLEELSANPASPFFGRVSGEFAVTGHSMGGVAALVAALEDPSMTAIAAFAPGDASAYELSSVTAPAVLFGGSDDYLTPADQFTIPFYQTVGSACKTCLILTGANHCQYAEYTMVCDSMEEPYPDPALTRTQQHALTHALLTPWLEFTLKGDAAAWVQFNELVAAGSGFSALHECSVYPTPSAVNVPACGSAGSALMAALMAVILSAAPIFGRWRSGKTTVRTER